MLSYSVSFIGVKLHYPTLDLQQEISEKSAGSKHGPDIPKEYNPNITPVKAPPMGGDLVNNATGTFDSNVCFVSCSR
jgi:hypothetical protein